MKLQVQDLTNLLVVSCGPGFLIAFATTTLLLIIASIYLIFFLRHQHALGAFLPITMAPAFIGCTRALFTMSTAMHILRSGDGNSSQSPDGMILLGISAMPLLLGIALSAPIFLAVSFARIVMLVKANLPVKQINANPESHETELVQLRRSIATETDDYLARLTRGRE